MTTLILSAILAAIVIPLIPDKEGKTVHAYSLGIELLHFIATIYVFWGRYDFGTSKLQLVETFNWMSQIGLTWSVGVDGLSIR